MNRYYSEITLQSDNTAGLTRLFDDIFKWGAKMHPDFSFPDNKIGKAHLKNIALNSGVFSELSELGLGTSGVLLRWSSRKNKLIIYQLSFCGQLCIEVWERMAKAYVPDCVVFYTAIDLDSSNYYTNSLELSGRYVVETEDSYNNAATVEDVAATLRKRYKGDFDKMLHSYQLASPKSLSIEKWTIMAINEVV